MTLTPIRETAQALSPEARRALLNTRPEVGASTPLPANVFALGELTRVRAIDLRGRLLPFGLMLREAVLDQELDTMDPPDVPAVLPMHIGCARMLSRDARGVLLAMEPRRFAPLPPTVTRVVRDELLSHRLIDDMEVLTLLGLVVQKAAQELDTPDPRDELVAWAKAWKAGGYAITSTRDQSAYARMVAAIEALS